MQLASPCILKPVPEEACVPSLGKVGIFLPSSQCSHQHSRFLSCISALTPVGHSPMAVALLPAEGLRLAFPATVDHL